tara:strand:+ start:228 stop:443 length:216 start_codon:yes stop_codon:yes gene_type:complete
MYIDKYIIEVKDKVWDEKKQTYKKEKDIVTKLEDSSGVNCKNFARLLDDLSDHRNFRGTVTVKVFIEQEGY